jgi:hypothetical protein
MLVFHMEVRALYFKLCVTYLSVFQCGVSFVPSCNVPVSEIVILLIFIEKLVQLEMKVRLRH